MRKQLGVLVPWLRARPHIVAFALAGALAFALASIALGAIWGLERQVDRQQQAMDRLQHRSAAAGQQAAILLNVRDGQMLIDQADLAQYRAQVTGLTNQVSQLQGENQGLKSQVQSLESQLPLASGLGAGPAVAGSGNHFAFGYCTWYVASRHYIPWFGNAIAWLGGARSVGWPTGTQPRAGSIEVAPLSGWGHVAWVESVNQDGSYYVTEMNYVAWDRVDRRLVRSGEAMGFIYPP